jgi:hypothetical protein
MSYESYEFSVIGSDIDKRYLIHKIEKEKRKEKELIGVASGMDIGHCAYLGMKYGVRFLERVKWYWVSDEVQQSLEMLRRGQPESIRVEFYGETEDRK